MNSVKKLLYGADQFAQACSIEYNRRQSHPSMPGGCASIFYLIFLLFYFSWRIQLFTSHERDDYMMATMQSSLLDREPMYLN